MKDEEKETLLGEIGEVLATYPQIELGYVHGSFVGRRYFRDIDIAVNLSEPSLQSYESFRFAMRVGTDVEKAIQPRYEADVKILNGSPIAFQFEVIKKGRLVYVRSEVNRIRYVARVLSEYQDYKPVLDWFDASFLAREVKW